MSIIFNKSRLKRERKYFIASVILTLTIFFAFFSSIIFIPSKYYSFSNEIKTAVKNANGSLNLDSTNSRVYDMDLWGDVIIILNKNIISPKNNNKERRILLKEAMEKSSAIRDSILQNAHKENSIME